MEFYFLDVAIDYSECTYTIFMSSIAYTYVCASISYLTHCNPLNVAITYVVALIFLMVVKYIQIKHIRMRLKYAKSELIKLFAMTLVFSISFIFRATINIIMSINYNILDDLQDSGGNYNFGWCFFLLFLHLFGELLPLQFIFILQFMTRQDNKKSWDDVGSYENSSRHDSTVEQLPLKLDENKLSQNLLQDDSRDSMIDNRKASQLKNSQATTLNNYHNNDKNNFNTSHKNSYDANDRQTHIPENHENYTNMSQVDMISNLNKDLDKPSDLLDNLSNPFHQNQKYFQEQNPSIDDYLDMDLQIEYRKQTAQFNSDKIREIRSQPQTFDSQNFLQTQNLLQQSSQNYNTNEYTSSVNQQNEQNNAQEQKKQVNLVAQYNHQKQKTQQFTNQNTINYVNYQRNQEPQSLDIQKHDTIDLLDEQEYKIVHKSIFASRDNCQINSLSSDDQVATDSLKESSHI
eukprot:403352068